MSVDRPRNLELGPQTARNHPRWEHVEVLARLFRDVGFPALVALYVLWRLDVSVQELTREIREQRQILQTTARELTR